MPRPSGEYATAQRALGSSVEVVRKPPKPTPEKALFAWAREWHEEGRSVDLDGLLLRRGFEVLPRRWAVERTFAWLGHSRRMSRDYERLCAMGEALVYAAMVRLTVRRLAHDRGSPNSLPKGVLRISPVHASLIVGRNLFLAQMD